MKAIDCSVKSNVICLRVQRNSGNKTYSSIMTEPSAPSKVLEIEGAAKSDSGSSIALLGTYYFINIPSVSRMEWHPISAASYENHASVVTFYIKPLSTGSWTHRVAVEVSRSAENFDVALDGPYGSLSLNILHYKHISILVGGIGITPALPILSLIKEQSSTTFPSLESVHLTWVLRDISIVDAFLTTLKEIFGTTASSGKSLDGGKHVEVKVEDIRLTMSLFLTSKGEDIETSKAITSNAIPFPLNRGRPALDLLVDNIVTEFSKEECMMFLCGPSEMTKLASQRACAAGVPFHTETFNY